VATNEWSFSCFFFFYRGNVPERLFFFGALFCAFVLVSSDFYGFFGGFGRICVLVEKKTQRRFPTLGVSWGKKKKKKRKGDLGGWAATWDLSRIFMFFFSFPLCGGSFAQGNVVHRRLQHNTEVAQTCIFPRSGVSKVNSVRGFAG
jgi:hypothetical protein